MRKFLEDTSGNIALTVALMGIPVMLSAGAAIDYSRLVRHNTILQGATDTAVLAVAPDLKNSTQAEIEQKVDDFLKSNLSALEYSQIKDQVVTVSAQKDRISVVAKSEAPTSIMKIAGIKSLSYAPESVVNIGGTGNIEVMLVLDNTGSMELDDKIGDLKVSATEFIDDIFGASGINNNAKVGIVPFARYVNVGLDNRNADWMNVPADYSETETVEMQDVISSSNCTQSTTPTFNFNTESYTLPKEICTNEYGPTYTDEVTKDYTWNGCAGSRNYPRNLNDEDFSFKVPGILQVACPNRITQLTSDSLKLKTEIIAMAASGSTYIPSGLVWGLRALSSGNPFDDSEDAQKILILMSDGENVSSLSPVDRSMHGGTDTDEANAYTKEVCDIIKADKIKIYTIGFGTTLPPTTIDLLKECSTGGKNYYNAADGTALSAAFESITTQLSSLHLSK